MAIESNDQNVLQPARFCGYLLNSMEESEARRKRRKRDTGPDLIGMNIKRDLLRRAVEEAPSAAEFERWLMEQVFVAEAPGSVRAMAVEIFADYQNACAHASFSEWLEAGAPTPRAYDRPQSRRG